MFFELKERCGDEDETRVEVAKGRVCSELAIQLHNNQSKRRCRTWLELKDFLKTEFAVDINLDRAWQEIDAAGYEWGESPQAFTNRFICQYAILETRFPREKLHSRDKSIKRKLWHGLPQESKEHLEGFLDVDYPLNKFIDREEHELKARHNPTLNRVKGAEDSEAPQTTKREELGEGRQHNAPKELGVKLESNEVESLKRQINELAEQVKRLQSTRETRQSPASNIYCRAHYKSTSYTLRECWRKPPPGVCVLTAGDIGSCR